MIDRRLAAVQQSTITGAVRVRAAARSKQHVIVALDLIARYFIETAQLGICNSVLISVW